MSTEAIFQHLIALKNSSSTWENSLALRLYELGHLEIQIQSGRISIDNLSPMRDVKNVVNARIKMQERFRDISACNALVKIKLYLTFEKRSCGFYLFIIPWYLRATKAADQCDISWYWGLRYPCAIAHGQYPIDHAVQTSVVLLTPIYSYLRISIIS